MKSFTKVAGAMALVLGSGLTSGAWAADMATMTCGDFSSLASDMEEIKVGGEMLTWINDTANNVAAGGLAFQYSPILEPNENSMMNDVDRTAIEGKKWTPDRMHIDIEAHCYGMPPETTILKALALPF